MSDTDPGQHQHQYRGGADVLQQGAVQEASLDRGRWAALCNISCSSDRKGVSNNRNFWGEREDLNSGNKLFSTGLNSSNIMHDSFKNILQKPDLHPFFAGLLCLEDGRLCRGL